MHHALTNPFLNMRSLPDHGAFDAIQAALDDELGKLERPEPEYRAEDITPILKELFKAAA